MISVRPEGRVGIWLPDIGQLAAWLRELTEPIHCFIPSGAMLIGADWKPEQVAREVEGAERVALLTGRHKDENMGHALAVITANELRMFDVGEVDDVISLSDEKGADAQGVR